MFKPSSKTVLLVAVTFLAASSLAGTAFAKSGHGNGNGNNSTTNNNNSTTQGGGPPACRDLQGDLNNLQQMVSGLASTVNNLSATVNTMNTTVSTLSARIDTINATVNATNSTVNTLSSRIDTINSNLDDLQSTVDDIQATLQAQGIGGLQASVDVNTTACTAGATQCATTAAAGSTNQNPVALTILVTSGSEPVTNLSASNFQFAVPFAPNGQAATFQVCTNGDTGCGTGTFFVNTGNGSYQIWVSPTANWMPGTYAGTLRITDTSGNTTMQQVDFTIPQ